MAQGVLALGFSEQAHAREHASRAPFLFLGRLPAPSLLTDGRGVQDPPGLGVPIRAVSLRTCLLPVSQDVRIRVRRQ